MKIRTALLAYFLAVVVLIGLGIALVGVIGGVALMGSFAMDSPTSTAGPAVHAALHTFGMLFVVWCAPAHEALKLTGANKSEFILVLGIVVEPICAAFFWALL